MRKLIVNFVKKFGRYALWLMVFGLFLGILSDLNSEDEHYCELCNESITQGKYVVIDNEYYYHKKCYNAAPRCPLCNHPITGEYVSDTGHNKFHTECYEEALVCSVCGGVVIQGKYITLEDGSVYHQKCYKRAPKCSLCNAPIFESLYLFKGRKYHHDCFDDSIKCGICGEPIVGEYKIDIYERHICLRHTTGKKCFLCNYPQVEVTMDDGRSFCGLCSKNAVNNQRTASALFKVVQQDVKKLFGLNIDHEIKLLLVNQRKFRKLASQNSASELGKFIRKTESISIPLVGTKTLKETFQVAILSGLPRKLFEGIAAHELTHAWQALHCSEKQSDEVKEGTAELVSYLYLQSKGSEIWMKRIEQNELDLYRLGFEQAYARYQQLGLSQYFQRVRTISTFSELD